MRRYEVNKRLEKMAMAIVWRLPRWVIYWSTVRAGAQAIRDDEIVPDVTYCDVLKRV